MCVCYYRRPMSAVPTFCVVFLYLYPDFVAFPPPIVEKNIMEYLLYHWQNIAHCFGPNKYIYDMIYMVTQVCFNRDMHRNLHNLHPSHISGSRSASPFIFSHTVDNNGQISPSLSDYGSIVPSPIPSDSSALIVL